jgi:hypothetical protein
MHYRYQAVHNHQNCNKLKGGATDSDFTSETKQTRNMKYVAASVVLMLLLGANIAMSTPAPRAEDSEAMTDDLTVIEAEHIWGTRWSRDDNTGEWLMEEVDCLDITDEEHQRVEEAGPNQMFFECPYPTVVLPDGTVTTATVIRKQESSD